MSANAQPTAAIFPAQGSKQSSSVLAQGIVAISTIEGNGSGAGSDRQRIPTEKILAAIARFVFSAKNKTYNFTIWGGNSIASALTGSPSGAAILQCIGTGTTTVSNSASAITGTGTVLDSCYFADEVTFTPSTTGTTPKGPTTSRATALGEETHDAFSPADSGVTPAELTLSAIGRFSFIVFEFTNESGTTKFVLLTRHRA